MTLTPETVRAALDAATPGPWRVEYDHGTTRLIAGGECTMCDETYYPSVPDNESDWHLIAMAPDLATAYLAQAEEIERLRSRLADVNMMASRDVTDDEAPCWLDGSHAGSWANGYNAALAAYRATEERT